MLILVYSHMVPGYIKLHHCYGYYGICISYHPGKTYNFLSVFLKLTVSKGRHVIIHNVVK